MKLISIQKLTSESFFKTTTLLTMLCNVESWLFLMPQTNGCGWLKKHPNPLLWMERKLCSWRSGESSFKIELVVHHWRWSLNQRPKKWDIQRLKLSAVFPDTIGMTSCADNPMVSSSPLKPCFKVTWSSLEISENFQHGNRLPINFLWIEKTRPTLRSNCNNKLITGIGNKSDPLKLADTDAFCTSHQLHLFCYLGELERNCSHIAG